MADSGVLATISGAALSLLFYENACGVGDQMGFLLGDMVTFVTKKVTDFERQVESVRRQIEITGVFACSAIGQISDETGRLHKEKLSAFVHNRSKEIVGWFRFRHNSRPVPTFRDKILHKELTNYFHECNGQLPKEYFVACILAATKTEKMGTHKFRHVLLRYEDGTYRPVPLKINNLGDNAARHDGSDYVPTPTARISQESDFFTKLVRSLKLDTRHKSGSDVVTTIQKAAEHRVKLLIPIVCESDQEISEMEKELHDLRLKIISSVMAQKKFATGNQRMNESKHREPMRTEGGDKCIKVDIREQPPPRTSNVHGDNYTEKDSPHPKTKGMPRPINMISPMRGPNDSAQRSPSSRFTNSQSSRKSADSDDAIGAADW